MPAPPKLECNRITGDVVIVAEERASRPLQTTKRQHQGQTTCPFCAGHENLTPPQVAAYPANAPWQVRVVPNKFPAVSAEPSLTGSSIVAGVHEVIIESPRHIESFTELSDSAIQLVFRVLRDRLSVAYQRNDVKYVQLFKNARADAGASLSHSHSQLLATSMLPPRVMRQFDLANDRESEKQECPLCVRGENASLIGHIVTALDGWLAVCPFGSRFPYQTWFFLTTHQSHFADCDDRAISVLALLVKRVIGRMEDQLDRPAYNFVVHSAPPEPGCRGFHWYAELFPRVATAGGFEWGSGAFINPVPAAKAASTLRPLDDNS